ncbi:hypothetical protein TrRE_jg3574 [Triparma retinervis]|nr:hypothetical protein TrRE_jg3574 [Triparma retinervis]
MLSFGVELPRARKSERIISLPKAKPISVGKLVLSESTKKFVQQANEEEKDKKAEQEDEKGKAKKAQMRGRYRPQSLDELRAIAKVGNQMRTVKWQETAIENKASSINALFRRLEEALVFDEQEILEQAKRDARLNGRIDLRGEKPSWKKKTKRPKSAKARLKRQKLTDTLRATPLRPKMTVTSTFQVDYSFERDLRFYGEREPVTPLMRRRPQDRAGGSTRPQSAPGKIVRHLDMGGEFADSNKHEYILKKEELAHVQKRLSAAQYGCDMRTFFKRQDKDRSGLLDPEEFRSILRRILRITPDELPDEDIYKLIQVLDTDKSGDLDINEIVAFIEEGERHAKEERKPRRKSRPMTAGAIRPNRKGKKAKKKKAARPSTAVGVR